MSTIDHGFVFDFRTLPEMLRHSAALWPERTAYQQYDYQENAWLSLSWKTFEAMVTRWRRAFVATGLRPGDRVSMLLTNSIDAVTFDQAALANGLVPVPLHAIDTAGSSAYILKDSGSRFLVTTARARWNAIHAADPELTDIAQVVFTNEVVDDQDHGIRLLGIESWLALGNGVSDDELPAGPEPEDLAAIVYTSGTTGRPKGVMLTHRNIVSNVQQVMDRNPIGEEDVFLSFLPLSHTFERTFTYYYAVANGATVAFARSVANIEADLTDIRPTMMASVPRVFERIYQKLQRELDQGPKEDKLLAQWALETGWRRFCRKNGLPLPEGSPEAGDDEEHADLLGMRICQRVRAIFGGRLRYPIIGGASLNYTVARFFCALGLPVQNGYGLTETSPVIGVTTQEMNHPATVGFPLRDTEARLGEKDELQVRGPQVMRGYWNKPRETAAAFTEDGWLRTGDQADLSDGGRIRIKGRIKEIIVTSTGEKISPVDLEFAIQEDLLFSQVFACGDSRPFISALVVVDPVRWEALCREMLLDPEDPATLTHRAMTRLLVKRIRAAAKAFPSYGIPRAVGILREPFTVENGLLTPTMKPRRPQILARYKDLIEKLYAGHPSS